jgi:arsenate reductase
MAEGYLRARYGDWYEAYSAGTNPSRISRKAIAAMKEIGVDISGQRSKSLDEFAGHELDLAVVLCDRAGTVCPIIPFAKETVHQSFPDPGGFTGTDEEVMARIREVRDRITRWIDSRFGDTHSNQ